MNLNQPFQFKLSSDIVPLLNRMEKELDTDSFVIRSVNIWPLIRVQFGYQLHLTFQKTGNISEVGRDDFYLKKIKELISFTIFYSSKVIKKGKMFSGVQKSGYDIFALPHKQHIVPYSKFRTINNCLDPVIDLFQKKGLSIYYYGKLNRLNCFPIPFFKTETRYSAPSKPLLLNKKEEDKISEILSTLSKFLEKYNKDLAIEFGKLKLQQNIIYLFQKSEYFQNLLLLVLPKFVISYVYYNIDVMAMNLAALKLGIPSIEVQHSAVSDNHFAYGPWLSMPHGGYGLMPDIYWVWSKSDQNLFERNFSIEITRFNVFRGGNQWINFYEKYINQREIKRTDKLLSEPKKTILLCLQGIGIPEFIINIMKSRKFNWLIRFHPRYPGDKDLVQSLIESGIFLETKLANSENLYSLFRLANYTVTFTSGTALESAEFGTPVIILGQNGFRNFKNQIESGQFFYASTEYEMLKIIENGEKPLPIENLIRITDLESETVLNSIIEKVNSYKKTPLTIELLDTIQ